MSDTELFAVIDPETKKVAYCCVLGMAGEVYGLLAYLGSRGLALYRRIRSGEVGAGDPRLLLEQDCLMVDFGGRDELRKEDLTVVRELGLRFRGRRAWPVFRSHRLNHAPWFLEEEEVRFLTVILDQAVEVCGRVKEEPRLLMPPRNGTCFLRRLKGAEWEDAWIQPEPYTPPTPPPLRIDESRLFRTRAKVERIMEEWQMALLVLPGIVMDRERPYFARLLLSVEPRSGYILTAHAMDPATYSESLVDAILDSIEKVSAMPKRVAVRDEAFKQQLEGPLRKLGIAVASRRSLPALEQAEMGFLAAISGGMPEGW